MTPVAALVQLLSSLFSAEELRAHLMQEPEGDELTSMLPGPGTPLAVLTPEAVAALRRRGIVDREFFDGLAQARPSRLHEIREVRAAWLHNPRLDSGESWAEGRYRLIAQRGRGGFGTVWEAIDTHTNARVALKILLEHQADDRRIRRRFFRGAEILSGLTHPAIVRVRSGVEQEGLRFFYVMEFVEGETLGALIGAHPPEALLEHVLEIGDALEHIHAHGLIHRDVKPGNILITAKGRACLVDFDLATGDAYLTTTTLTPGTAVYTPPESGTADSKTPAYDVYGLSRTVEHVLRGHPPTAAERAAPDPMVTLDATEAVKDVLRAALRVDPHTRTQTADEFCRRLRAALAQPGPEATSPATIGDIDPDAVYYTLTLTVDKDGRVVQETQTRFVGWADDKPGHELRKPRAVVPERMINAWHALGETPVVIINDDRQFVGYYIHYGGNALIKDSVALKWLPGLFQVQRMVHAGPGMGFSSSPSEIVASSRPRPGPKQRMDVMTRDRFRCRLCGKSADDGLDVRLEPHHIREHERGGPTLPWNLITLCEACRKGLGSGEHHHLYQKTEQRVALSERLARYQEGVRQWQAAMKQRVATRKGASEEE